jgi:hypothetical protein
LAESKGGYFISFEHARREVLQESAGSYGRFSFDLSTADWKPEERNFFLISLSGQRDRADCAAMATRRRGRTTGGHSYEFSEFVNFAPIDLDRLMNRITRSPNKGHHGSIKQGVRPMSDPKLEFPEVVGKFVAELSVYEDAEFGKEVLVRFTDGTQLSIAVGDGSTTDAVVGTKFPPKELVRYLSQSFVEKLCSDDYEGVDLAQEIEGVIFGHLDPTDTLNASSFTDLRDLRTRETTKDRVSISGRITSIISEDEQLRAVLREVPKKKDRVEEIAVEIKALEGQLPVAKNETEAKAQTELGIFRQQLLKQQSNVASQKQISLGFDQLAASLERFNGEFQTFRTDFLAQASKLGITQGEIDITLSVTGQDVLAKRKAAVTAVSPPYV